MSVGAATPPTLYGVDLGLPLESCRILIADDSAYSRKTLTRFLQWIGITQIRFAETGTDLLDQVAQYNPDLLLLDVETPDMDGIAICRGLRENARWRDLPILMQSAVNSDQLRTVCFSAGATDLIAKPINPGECIARVRYHLERRSMVQELRAFRARVERDLAQARSMQLALAPEPAMLAALETSHGLAIDPAFRTSDEIGGDFWTAFPIDADRAGVFVADLSGHGIAAAINAFRLHTLLSRTAPEEFLDPARLLAQLNLRLCDILPVGQFATAFYGVIDRRDDTLLYAAAGAPSPIQGDGAGFRMLDAAGLFLGAFREASYENHRQPMGHGDTLFLYSDGLSEACDADGAMLGEPGLVRLVEQATARGGGRTLATLLALVAERYGDQPQDDLTAVWITRR